MRNKVKQLHDAAMDFTDMAFAAKRQKQDYQAKCFFKQAFECEIKAAHLSETEESPLPPEILYRSAATLAIDCDEISEAQKIIHFLLKNYPSAEVIKDIWELRQNCLANFTQKMYENQQDIPPEFDKIFKENFWDLLL